MRMSLVSREVIADSIELVVSGHALDGIVALGARLKGMMPFLRQEPVAAATAGRGCVR